MRGSYQLCFFQNPRNRLLIAGGFAVDQEEQEVREHHADQAGHDQPWNAGDRDKAAHPVSDRADSESDNPALQVPQDILVGRKMGEIVPEDHTTSPKKVDPQHGNDGRPEDSGDAKVLSKEVIQRDIAHRLRNRNIALLPEQAPRAGIDGQHIAGFEQIQIYAEHRHGRNRKQHPITGPQSHKGLIQAQHTDGAPSGSPHIQKIHAEHILMVFLLALHSHAIAGTAGGSAGQHLKKAGDGIHDIVIVSINGVSRQAQKHGNENAVEGIPAYGGNSADHRPPHHGADVLRGAFRELPGGHIFRERVSGGKAGYQIAHYGAQRHDKQIHIEIADHQKDSDLKRVHQQLHQ